METFLAVAVFTFLFLLLLLDWRLLIALKEDKPFTPLHRRMVNLYWRYGQLTGKWDIPIFSFYMGSFAAWGMFGHHALLCIVSVGYFLLHVQVYGEVMERRPFINHLEAVLSVTSTSQYEESTDAKASE